MDETITITRSQLVAIYTAWETDARANNWPAPDSIAEHAERSADELIARHAAL